MYRTGRIWAHSVATSHRGWINEKGPGCPGGKGLTKGSVCLSGWSSSTLWGSGRKPAGDIQQLGGAQQEPGAEQALYPSEAGL